VLAAADVVVLPSLIEGLPLAVLEAMACARPVIATRVNGTQEAVVDGTTGLLIAPHDDRALADAIVRLIDDPARARRMGIAGRQRVQRHYALEQFVSSIQTVYGELLARRDLRHSSVALF
jgi:glycosyltransferase involved in cell wall biosynthesis